MINCAFIIFMNCNHLIKELIPLSSSWCCSLNCIHALNIRRNVVLIERNIGAKSLKPVYIIGWWTATDSFINGKICILEFITDIQNTGRKYMHSHNSNVDSEWFIMFHWTLGLIKTNNFNLRTPIFTVACKHFPCIITVTFLNNWVNE